MKKAMNIVVLFVLVAIFVTMAFVVPAEKSASLTKTCGPNGCQESQVNPCFGTICTKQSVLHSCPDGGCQPSELIPCEGDICVRN